MTQEELELKNQNKAKRILAIQLLADTIEMYMVELEDLCTEDETFTKTFKYKAKSLKNLSKDFRKSGDLFFKNEEHQFQFGDLAEAVKEGVDKFLDIN